MPRFAPIVAPTITPADLIERLRVVMRARSDEQLAGELDIPLRSLSNYKKGQEMSFSRTVELLDLAGWLNLNGSEEVNLARARATAVHLADRIADLADALGVPQSDRES